MSRRIIPNAPDSPAGRETTVGWDAPLATFFAMAFDPPASGDLDDDEIQVFWHGLDAGEIPTVEELARVLAGHGVQLPPEKAAILRRDKDREGDHSDNLGRRILDAMRGEGQAAGRQA